MAPRTCILNNILSNPEVLIRDKKITRVAHKEFLGEIVDENLNWHKHIDTQCKKISKNIALLRRAKSYMTENNLITR